MRTRLLCLSCARNYSYFYWPNCWKITIWSKARTSMARGGSVERQRCWPRKYAMPYCSAHLDYRYNHLFPFDSSSTCKFSGARKWATFFFSIDLNSHVVTTLQRSTYRKIQAKELGNNFRAVTEIVEASLDDLLSKMQPDSIVTKNHYVAINASDVNFTNGKYTPDVKP